MKDNIIMGMQLCYELSTAYMHTRIHAYAHTYMYTYIPYLSV